MESEAEREVWRVVVELVCASVNFFSELVQSGGVEMRSTLDC